MSILEKTINLLGGMAENQIEAIYSYARFLTSQAEEEQEKTSRSLTEIFDNIVGALEDTGKDLADYREERIRERYGTVN